MEWIETILAVQMQNFWKSGCGVFQSRLFIFRWSKVSLLRNYIQGWLTAGEPVRWSLLETWWFQFEVLSDEEGNLHNCKGKHSTCICRPNEFIKYVYLISLSCSLALILMIFLRESFFRIITRIMKIRNSTK